MASDLGFGEVLSSLGVHSLGVYSLWLPIIDLGMYSLE